MTGAEDRWKSLRGVAQKWLRIEIAVDLAEFQAALHCLAYAITLTFFTRLYGAHERMLALGSQEAWAGMFLCMFVVLTIGHVSPPAIHTACTFVALTVFLALFILTARSNALPLSTASFAVQSVVLGFCALVKR